MPDDGPHDDAFDDIDADGSEGIAEFLDIETLDDEFFDFTPLDEVLFLPGDATIEVYSPDLHLTDDGQWEGPAEVRVEIAGLNGDHEIIFECGDDVDVVTPEVIVEGIGGWLDDNGRDDIRVEFNAELQVEAVAENILANDGVTDDSSEITVGAMPVGDNFGREILSLDYDDAIDYIGNVLMSDDPEASYLDLQAKYG